jgi:large subunit ribosomal protein L19
MSHLIIQALERKLAGKKLAVLRPGYRVKVHQKIKEGEKERIQIFEGVIVALNAGHGASKTVTVRKEVEGIGVEKIFPLASPNVAKIDIIKTFGVRRAKLYYLREGKGVSSRLRAKLGLVDKDTKHGDKNVERHASKDKADEAVEEAAAPEAKVQDAPVVDAPSVETADTVQA